MEYLDISVKAPPNFKLRDRVLHGKVYVSPYASIYLCNDVQATEASRLIGDVHGLVLRHGALELDFSIEYWDLSSNIDVVSTDNVGYLYHDQLFVRGPVVLPVGCSKLFVLVCLWYIRFSSRRDELTLHCACHRQNAPRLVI